jgi:hypothetical protein
MTSEGNRDFFLGFIAWPGESEQRGKRFFF